MIGDEVLAGAVALDDGTHHVLRHVLIVGEELLGVLGQAVAAVTEGGVVVVRADARVETHALDDRAGVETAGLGARIKDDPAFQDKFKGERPDFESDKVFEIVKGGSPKEDGTEVIDNKIDAITGATMTSKGLEEAIDIWLAAYAKYFIGSEITPLGEDDSVTVTEE